MCEIIGSVVIDCGLGAKFKITDFFHGMFVGDSRKFMLKKNLPLYSMKKLRYIFVCTPIYVGGFIYVFLFNPCIHICSKS